MPPTQRLLSLSLLFSTPLKSRAPFIPRHPASLRFRMASTAAVRSPSHVGANLPNSPHAPRTQLGLKDASLVRTQAYIDGKWVNAKSGAVIKVTSACPLPSRMRARR